MLRVNSVLGPGDEIRSLSQSEKAELMRACEIVQGWFDADTEIENPAIATTGLSDLVQTGLTDFTGDDFVAAIRVILQARNAADNLAQYANAIAREVRPLGDFDAHERRYMRGLLANAHTMYRQLYRSQVRVDFRKIIGIKKIDFEDAIFTVERFLGGQ